MGGEEALHKSTHQLPRRVGGVRALDWNLVHFLPGWQLVALVQRAVTFR